VLYVKLAAATIHVLVTVVPQFYLYCMCLYLYRKRKFFISMSSIVIVVSNHSLFTVRV
jgi:hypothetical protein